MDEPSIPVKPGQDHRTLFEQVLDFSLNEECLYIQSQSYGRALCKTACQKTVESKREVQCTIDSQYDHRFSVGLKLSGGSSGSGRGDPRLIPRGDWLGIREGIVDATEEMSGLWIDKKINSDVDEPRRIQHRYFVVDADGKNVHLHGGSVAIP
jgi:hypothetical protein